MKKILIFLLSICLLMSSTITVFAEGTATITIDLNGGTESVNGFPSDWTKLEEGKYSKEYLLNERVYLADEWSDYKPTKTNYEFDSWQNDNYDYWEGMGITDDIIVKATYKPYYYVIMDLKGGTVPGEVPSEWEIVPGHNDQYRKKFLEDTYYGNITSEWDGVIPQYGEEKGFVGWETQDGWYFLETDESIINAKTDIKLNVILDLKGGTFPADNIPTGWTKVEAQEDKYTKKYVKGVTRYEILDELNGVVPQYSAESNKGFIEWKTPEWYELETDGSTIEANVGTLRTVTLDFDGDMVLSADPSWTYIETGKYTKKYPEGYYLYSISSEISSSFSIKEFDGNRYFANYFDCSPVSNVPDNDTALIKAHYVNAVNITIKIPENGILVVGEEQKDSDFNLAVPESASASCNNGILTISSYSPNVEYKIEVYGNSGYELDYFTYNESTFNYQYPLSAGGVFSAVMKAGTQKYPIWIDGEQLSEEKTTLLDGAISYDWATRTLTLDGADIVFSSNCGISFATSTTIKVESNSSITTEENGNDKRAISGVNIASGISSYDDPSSASNLNIVGDGKLTINLKKTDAYNSYSATCVEGIFANKIEISTDVEIIGDIIRNTGMGGASFSGINSGDTDGVKVDNGKSVSVYVKSVSSGADYNTYCYLIGGPLTIADNASVDLSVGSFISDHTAPTFGEGVSLLAGTISISSNPVGNINLSQVANLNTIDGATAGATTSDTSFIQASTSNPLILSTKGLVLVEGVSMNKSEFKSTETVGYTGTPTAKKKADSSAVTINNWNYTYYKESAEGSNSWNKLSSAPTDEGSYKLVVEVQDSNYFGKLELPFTVVHAHSFTYAVNSENDAQLTATCSGANCEYNDTPLTLTLISPSTSNLVYDGSAKEINFADGEKDEWEEKTESTAPTIVYYLEDGSTKTTSTNSGASGEGLAPKNAGTYKAKVTVDTNKTAELEFSIAPKESAASASSNEWKKGSAVNLVITSDALFDEFICVEVDDVELENVDNVNYLAETGSTKVTLYKTYLDSLPVGSHTFKIVSKNEIALATINVTSNSGGNDNPSHSSHTVPNTGIN